MFQHGLERTEAEQGFVSRRSRKVRALIIVAVNERMLVTIDNPAIVTPSIRWHGTPATPSQAHRDNFSPSMTNARPLRG